MKTVSAGMTTHVAQQVTTLASLWEVTRKDGVVLRFTDHNKDITFATNLYKSNSGFSRSTIQSKTDLSVDNSELTGILNSADITAADIRAGKYDFAALKFFLVNWQDPDGDGQIKMRRGILGEVVLTNDGTYDVELRGLSQIFAQRILELYTPDCRVDLFSPKCGLASADFRETGIVDTQAGDRQVFTTKEFFTKIETPLTSTPDIGDNTGVNIAADGTLTLATEPLEDGSEKFPFIINDTTDLTNIRNNPDACYAMGDNIDMSGFGLFVPIPDFGGSLDGRGYYILSIDLDQTAVPTDTGLMANTKLGSTIRRLGMVNPTIASGSITTYAGAFVADDGVTASGGLIEDCYVIGGTLETDGALAGGMVGRMGNNGTVRRCFVGLDANITGATPSSVGNVVGTVESGGAMTNVFYDDEASGLTQSGSGATSTALTTAASVLEASFTGFDFSDAWRIATATADPAITFADTNPDTIVRDAGSWLVDGFRDESRIIVAGSVSNNTAAGVTLAAGIAPVALTLTLDAAETLVAEGPVSSITIAAYPRLMQDRCI